MKISERSYLQLSVFAVVASILGDPFLCAASLPPEVATRIDRLFARWDRPEIPGAVVAIARAGETVYSRGFGMANLEHSIPMARRYSLRPVRSRNSLRRQRRRSSPCAAGSHSMIR